MCALYQKSIGLATIPKGQLFLTNLIGKIMHSNWWMGNRRTVLLWTAREVRIRICERKSTNQFGGLPGESESKITTSKKHIPIFQVCPRTSSAAWIVVQSDSNIALPDSAAPEI